MIKSILEFIDGIPLVALIAVTALMALSPFVPEPHLVEKTRMLMQGELTKPIDIFDLFFHSFLFVVLAIRLLRYKKSNK